MCTLSDDVIIFSSNGHVYTPVKIEWDERKVAQTATRVETPLNLRVQKRANQLWASQEPVKIMRCT